MDWGVSGEIGGPELAAPHDAVTTSPFCPRQTWILPGDFLGMTGRRFSPEESRGLEGVRLAAVAFPGPLVLFCHSHGGQLAQAAAGSAVLSQAPERAAWAAAEAGSGPAGLARAARSQSQPPPSRSARGPSVTPRTRGRALSVLPLSSSSSLVPSAHLATPMQVL